MNTFEATHTQIQMLLTTGQLATAEEEVDALADLDPDALGRLWRMEEGAARHNLSILYNQIGAHYQGVGIQAHQQNNRAGGTAAARGAERCHEKALDLYDMSAEDFMYFPTDSPFNANLIFTFWGLGTAKYILGKDAESRKYLLLCLRLPTQDEQTASWHVDASNYLRLLDGKPIQLVVRATSVMPNLFNPQLLTVEGELLEWGAYAKPNLKQYSVYVNDEMINHLAAQGFGNAIALEGHVLVLVSSETGDLRRPLSLVRVL